MTAFFTTQVPFSGYLRYRTNDGNVQELAFSNVGIRRDSDFIIIAWNSNGRYFVRPIKDVIEINAHFYLENDQ